MRRWNGWGDEANKMDLPETGDAFLQEHVGDATPLADADLASVLAQVPESRMPSHPLIETDAEIRLRHARGQSLPDWLAMRSGKFEFFPDGVALPETKEQVAELVKFAYDNDIILIPYGGGTSVAGHINPFNSDKPILTLALTRLCRLTDLDESSMVATFGAGTAFSAQLRLDLRPRRT